MLNQPTQRINATGKRTAEWVLAIIAVIVCTVIPLIFAYYQLSVPIRSFAEIIPFPALYFIEIISLGFLGMVAVYKDDPVDKPFWNIVPWIGGGIMLSFVILGGFTIGFYLIPSLIAFFFLGVLMDRRKNGNFALHFIYFISAGIAQSVIFYIVVSILRF
jgi:hypothetical protein